MIGPTGRILIYLPVSKAGNLFSTTSGPLSELVNIIWSFYKVSLGFLILASFSQGSSCGVVWFIILSISINMESNGLVVARPTLEKVFQSSFIFLRIK